MNDIPILQTERLLLRPQTMLDWRAMRHEGYAYEASQALRAWAFETGHFETLVSYINIENVRSQKLAERMGAILDSETPRPSASDLVYRHPANG